MIAPVLDLVLEAGPPPGRSDPAEPPFRCLFDSTDHPSPPSPSSFVTASLCISAALCPTTSHLKHRTLSCPAVVSRLSSSFYKIRSEVLFPPALSSVMIGRSLSRSNARSNPQHLSSRPSSTSFPPRARGKSNLCLQIADESRSSCGMTSTGSPQPFATRHTKEQSFAFRLYCAPQYVSVQESFRVANRGHYPVYRWHALVHSQNLVQITLNT